MKTELFEVALRICGAAQREWMAIPRQLTIGGRPGAFVTNGHVLLVAWGEPAADPSVEPPMPGTVATAVAQMLGEKPPHSETAVSLSELNAWIGPGGCEKCKGKLTVKCDGCAGGGKVRHRCDCNHCMFDGLETCEACDGDRVIGCDCDVTQGCMFFGQCFDRRVLRLGLPRTDETVSVDWTGNETVPIRVRGEDWTMVAMGMRLSESDKPLPAFSATERTVVA